MPLVSYFTVTLAQTVMCYNAERGELAQFCWDAIFYSGWKTNKKGKSDMRKLSSICAAPNKIHMSGIILNHQLKCLLLSPFTDVFQSF